MQALQVKPKYTRCLWRQARPKLSHFVLKAQASSAEEKRDAVAERIRKAKLYREPTSDQARQSKQQASLTQPATERSASASTDAPEQLKAFGDSQASQQAEQLFAAVQELQNKPQALSTADTDTASISQAQPQSAASRGQSSPSSSASSKSTYAQQETDSPQTKQASQALPGKAMSKADMLAKISQAKAYKQEKQAKPGSTPEIIPLQSVTPSQQPQQQQQASNQPKDSFSATQRRSAQQEGNSQADEPEEEAQVENEGLGSASQAAGYLQQAVKGTDASKGMRMETYSELKEQEMRNQKV